MSTHTQRLSLTAMVIGLLAFSITVQAQQSSQTIYKWIDENGVPHYEMSKPSDSNIAVEVIKQRRTEPASDSAAAEPATNASNTAATEKADETAAVPETKKPKKDPKICELARSNLEQLQNRSQISIVDEYGNERILDEKEVANQIKRAQDAVKTNCN